MKSKLNFFLPKFNLNIKVWIERCGPNATQSSDLIFWVCCVTWPLLEYLIFCWIVLHIKTLLLSSRTADKPYSVLWYSLNFMWLMFLIINGITKLWMQVKHRDAVFCLSFLWVLIHSILSKILLDSRVHYNLTFVLLIQSFPF